MNQEEMEEYAFYESGLCAHGCLEKLDEYAKQCIKRYGRILLNQQKGKKHLQNKNATV
jgi:hypothetical protein